MCLFVAELVWGIFFPLHLIVMIATDNKYFEFWIWVLLSESGGFAGKRSHGLGTAMQVETCHGRLVGQGQLPCILQVCHLQCHLDEGIWTHLDTTVTLLHFLSEPHVAHIQRWTKNQEHIQCWTKNKEIIIIRVRGNPLHQSACITSEPIQMNKSLPEKQPVWDFENMKMILKVANSKITRDFEPAGRVWEAFQREEAEEEKCHLACLDEAFAKEVMVMNLQIQVIDVLHITTRQACRACTCAGSCKLVQDVPQEEMHWQASQCFSTTFTAS